MLERGCEIIYDIIVASGGNTSPYRRWATDKIIRQGDLVIVDINAVGPPAISSTLFVASNAQEF